MTSPRSPCNLRSSTSTSTASSRWSIRRSACRRSPTTAIRQGATSESEWLRANGANWENSDGGGGLDTGYHNIATTGDGRWTVTGTICDVTATVACALYGTVRLHSDEIFGSGLD